MENTLHKYNNRKDNDNAILLSDMYQMELNGSWVDFIECQYVNLGSISKDNLVGYFGAWKLKNIKG